MFGSTGRLGITGLASILVSMATWANAAPCLEVTLTGTQGGPPIFNGQAGAGTLVRYGDDSKNCSDVLLQFDAGRGTLQQLSKLKVPAGKINAVFLTHIHSDHTDGLADLMQIRWHFGSAGPKVDLVCNSDVKAKPGHVMSCSKLAEHLGDAYIASGEIAQRLVENKKRLPGGPSDLLNVATFDGTAQPQEVWRSGDVVVTAVASRHVAGHASYRVDTPAGSVVIGGDAGNDVPKPPRKSSTSASVERLAQGADIVVHSTIHPVMGPDMDSGFPPPVYFRQSTASDLGSMAQRAGVKILMLTHLIPPLGTKNQGPYKVPGGALTKEDYANAAKDAGFEGNVIVGTDLATTRLPSK
ncbi:MAG: MBL fold metallo-hydrolase [Rhodobacteraceae bacterium]|nr:MBL fold metallo-hydrolase [Paracoccaceae bacterium]